MDSNKEIRPLKRQFDFADVPQWYVLCTNNQCPMQTSCLRFMAAQNAPDNLELARCVMPKMLKGGKCRWYDKRSVVVWALGFSSLFDRVMKKDFTPMRKAITRYLHGVKFYYEYKRGDRPLSPEQQQWIRNFVKSYGYEWEVPFDSYYEDYAYHHLALLDENLQR